MRLSASIRAPSAAAALLVRDEPGDEDLSELVTGKTVELIVVLVVEAAHHVIGHKRGRLDVEERRGYEKEVACHVQVEHAEPLDLFEVLARHLGDGDGPDVHLLPGYELQQQIERAGIGLC